jgi:hypothetical protein
MNRVRFSRRSSPRNSRVFTRDDPHVLDPWSTGLDLQNSRSKSSLKRRASLPITRVSNTARTRSNRQMDRLQRALEATGAEFTNGDQPGVRFNEAAAAHSAEAASAPKPTVAAKAGRGKTAKATEEKR